MRHVTIANSLSNSQTSRQYNNNFPVPRFVRIGEPEFRKKILHHQVTDFFGVMQDSNKLNFIKKFKALDFVGRPFRQLIYKSEYSGGLVGA